MYKESQEGYRGGQQKRRLTRELWMVQFWLWSDIMMVQEDWDGVAEEHREGGYREFEEGGGGEGGKYFLALAHSAEPTTPPTMRL